MGIGKISWLDIDESLGRRSPVHLLLATDSFFGKFFLIHYPLWPHLKWMSVLFCSSPNFTSNFLLVQVWTEENIKAFSVLDHGCDNALENLVGLGPISFLSVSHANTHKVFPRYRGAWVLVSITGFCYNYSLCIKKGEISICIYICLLF